MMFSIGACANSGSSSSSSDGSSGNALTSDGSSRNDGSSNNGGSSGGSSGSTATTAPGAASPGTAPADASAPPPPSDFTLPQPDANGNVRVPAQPPAEVRNESPRQRLRDLPPVPRSCLDDDLTLLDVFAPFVSVPVRLVYCLLYIGTIPRLPSEIHVTVTTPSLHGPNIRVALLAPDHTQRPLATLALIVLVIVLALLIGYAVGRRRRGAA
jgi:hypothetical protein